MPNVSGGGFKGGAKKTRQKRVVSLSNWTPPTRLRPGSDAYDNKEIERLGTTKKLTSERPVGKERVIKFLNKGHYVDVRMAEILERVHQIMPLEQRFALIKELEKEWDMLVAKK